MNIVIVLKEKIINAFHNIGFEISLNDVVIENTKDKLHGDYACNCALKFAKSLSMSPMDLANKIVANLDMNGIEKIEIAKPGFLNFFLQNDSLTGIVEKIICEDKHFGHAKRNGQKINVEFVSANPTGLLHIGTARGAAYGDSLSRILDAAGYDVTREYYINDAGVQITHLGESLIERCKEGLGLPFELPEDGYHGNDVKSIAKSLIDIYGNKLIDMFDNLDFFKEYAMKIELERIVEDLKNFRIIFDVFSSEKAIRGNNAVENEINFLTKYSYTSEGAIYLKTSDFLDDKDRVIVKSDKDYTYFLPDIVYHVNKMSRGFDKLIDVLGADHHGYINRMKSALMMHGFDKDVLEIELIQMVRFIKNGQEYKASKRAGDAITLRDICSEVGVDPMRYFFAMRAPESHLDFDMDLAIEQSSNNPVYYAQYAHARLCSILEQGKDILINPKANLLCKESEVNLLKHLSSFEATVIDAARDRAPFKITNYIHELAELVHSFYSECRVIDRDSLEVSASRLALCKASKIVLNNALNLIGVIAPEHM